MREILFGAKSLLNIQNIYKISIKLILRKMKTNQQIALIEDKVVVSHIHIQKNALLHINPWKSHDIFL